MRELPESRLDGAAAVGNHKVLDDRADRLLRRRAEAARGPLPRHRRAAILEHFAIAYIARAAAIRARLAGRIDEAIKLERQSERALALARDLAATPTVDVSFEELMNVSDRRAFEHRRR